MHLSISGRISEVLDDANNLKGLHNGCALNSGSVIAAQLAETCLMEERFNATYQTARHYRDAAGHRIIDKEHRGVRIYMRLGRVSDEPGGAALASRNRTDRLGTAAQGTNLRRFSDCAARYLEESRDKRTADVTAWHVRLLIPYLGSVAISQIHDETLKAFIADRLQRA